MKDSYQYKAFISYSHADEKWAKWLLRSLEAYRVPRHIVERYALDTNRLIPIFRDREELASSGDLSATIQNALTESASLIVICSPAAAASRWVNEEVKVFKQMGKGDQVFCLVVGDPANSFPPEVLVDTDGDGIATAEETEPLAADPGSDADGKAGAKLKLISGLLNVGLDELRQRENRRRFRRLAFISAGSIAAMVIAVALSVFAVVSRNEATRQQAVAERQAATSQRVTDFLVDLFNSSDPFTEPGVDLTATQILSRGAEKIGRELRDEPIIQARLLSAIGKVYMQLGFYDEAEKHLSQAVVLQRDLPGDTNEILRTRIDRAWVAIQSENLELAMSIYKDILPPLNDQAEYIEDLPNERIWASALNDFGVLLHVQGDYTKAQRVLKQAIELHEKIGTDLHTDYAAALGNLGLVKGDQGDHRAASQLYDRALEIQSLIDGADHPSLVALLMNSASSLRRQGELHEARVRLERALTICEASFDANHPSIAYVSNGLGIVLFKLGDYEEALRLLVLAGEIMTKIQGPTHSFIGANFQHQARVFTEVGDLAQARKLYEKSMSSYIGSLGAEHPEIIGVYAEFAELLSRQNQWERAEVLFLQSLEMAEKEFGTTHHYSVALRQNYNRFLDRLNRQPLESP
jgi:tetratricopeptide (TPR) repeat protein